MAPPQYSQDRTPVRGWRDLSCTSPVADRQRVVPSMAKCPKRVIADGQCVVIDAMISTLIMKNIHLAAPRPRLERGTYCLGGTFPGSAFHESGTILGRLTRERHGIRGLVEAGVPAARKSSASWSLRTRVLEQQVGAAGCRPSYNARSPSASGSTGAPSTGKSSYLAALSGPRSANHLQTIGKLVSRGVNHLTLWEWAFPHASRPALGLRGGERSSSWVRFSDCQSTFDAPFGIAAGRILTVTLTV